MIFVPQDNYAAEVKIASGVRLHAGCIWAGHWHYGAGVARVTAGTLHVIVCPLSPRAVHVTVAAGPVGVLVSVRMSCASPLMYVCVLNTPAIEWRLQIPVPIPSNRRPAGAGIKGDAADTI